ncbi:hypothetical protein ACFRNJ_12365 [Streptomyces sp. NPDC056721]|uniref:hypothetical protein n=1 Tax=Streptomyces sp. NPDC056721 TaxID=3345923 RepID=UPI0036C183C8
MPGILREFWLENPDGLRSVEWLPGLLESAEVRSTGWIEIEVAEQQREALDRLAHSQFMTEGGRGNNLVAKAAFAVYHQVHQYEARPWRGQQ